MKILQTQAPRCCVACHRRLAEDRGPKARLAEFCEVCLRAIRRAVGAL
jgi:hypothetical protein